MGELLKIFARSITEWTKEVGNTSEEDEDNGNNIVINIEAEDEKLAKPGKAK